MAWSFSKWFTPPKSKSPYEAMTSGSTGGWASSFAHGKSMGFVGPLSTMLAGLIPGVGPAVSAGMGAAGTMGGKGSWLGNSGYQGSDYGSANWMPTLMGAAAGYGAGSLGKGIGNFASKGGFQKAATSIGNWGKPVANAVANASMAGVPTGFGDFSAYKPSVNTPGSFGASNALSPLTGAVSYGAGSLGASAAPAASAGSWFNPKTIAGLGLAASTALGGSQQAPTSPYMTDYMERLTKGSPLSNWATTQYTDLMNRPEPKYTPLSDEMYEAAVRRNKEEETQSEKALRAEYKGIRPGADIEGDSGFRKSLMENRQKFGNERMAINTELGYARENEYNQRLDDYYKTKGSYLLNTMKLSQDEVNMYGQLAQMDRERLMTDYGLKAGEAAQFKQLFGDVSQLLMSSGLGMNYWDRISGNMGLK